MDKKISKIEAICIFIMLFINTILLNAPQILIDNCKTGAFLNSIYIGILAFIFIIILNKIFKYFPSSDILDVSKFLGGNILRFIIGILFISILMLIICVSLAHFTILLKTIYFRNSPILFIIFFFIISAFICNLNGFGAVKKSICFYFPITVLTILIILQNQISNFNFTKITPFFGDSFENTFFKGTSNIFIFTNIILIYFLLPFLESDKSFKKITIISFFISWILLVFMVMIILNNYPFNNTISNVNPVYLLTRKVELSDFVQRSDALFIFIWILSYLSYITFFLYFITLIIKKIFTIENEKMIVYPVVPLIIGITYLLIRTNFYKFGSFELYKNLFNITVYIISLLILFFAGIKKKLI